MSCKRLTTKKYTTRKGPPYPANGPNCRGGRRLGNDGLLYESKPNKNNVYRWVKVKVTPICANGVCYIPNAKRTRRTKPKRTRKRTHCDLTVRELHAMARQHKIRGRSTMKKAALCTALRQYL